MDARSSVKIDPDVIKEIVSLTTKQLRKDLSRVEMGLTRELRELREMRESPVPTEDEYISQPEAIR